MIFHKTKTWQKKRSKILRRDGYLCRNCKRFGKTIEAKVVHHIYPIEDYPEWKLANCNLISLCEDCHNAMHDRLTNILTETGKNWKERTPPPSEIKK